MDNDKIIKYMTTKKYRKNYVCWDFVREVCKDLYKMDLPEYPVDKIIHAEGRKVLEGNVPHIRIDKCEDIQEGDIIVFSMFTQQHAGVMIDKDNFIHLSRDRGVCVTMLNNIKGEYAIYRKL